MGHAEEEHMCSALMHTCGEVRSHLVAARIFLLWLLWFISRAPSEAYDYLAGRRSRVRKPVIYPCMFLLRLRPTSDPTNSPFRSEQEHESHSCDTMICPVTCELCTRPCNRTHLHGITPGAHHLCGSVYSMNFPLWTSDDLYFV